MGEAVFLVVLGAFAVLYAAGWFAISSPKGKRREALSHAWLKIRQVLDGAPPRRRGPKLSQRPPGYLTARRRGDRC
jgi:hypothetical protein